MAKTHDVACSGDRHAPCQFQCPPIASATGRPPHAWSFWRPCTGQKRTSAADTLNLRTAAGKLFLQLFEAAIQMVDPLHQCFTFRRQPGDDQ